MSVSIEIDLVTHMYASLQNEDDRPTVNFCREVTRKLVMKYPFMADAQAKKRVGQGYVSVYTS